MCTLLGTRTVPLHIPCPPAPLPAPAPSSHPSPQGHYGDARERFVFNSCRYSEEREKKKKIKGPKAMRKQFTSSFYYCSVKEVYIQRVFPAKHSKMAFESGASPFLAPQPAALPRRPLTWGLHALPFSLFSRTPPPTPRFPGVPASSFSLGRCEPRQCLSSRLPLVPNSTPSPPLGPPVWRFPPGSPEYFSSLVSGAAASPLQFRTGSWSRPVRDSSSSAVGLLSTQNKGGEPWPPFPSPSPYSQLRDKK